VEKEPAAAEQAIAIHFIHATILIGNLIASEPDGDIKRWNTQ